MCDFEEDRSGWDPYEDRMCELKEEWQHDLEAEGMTEDELPFSEWLEEYTDSMANRRYERVA
jgi:hypothetical protein